MALERIVKGMAAGLVGGLAAAWVMNQFQMRLSKTLERQQKPHGAQALQDGSPEHGAGAALKKRGLDDPSDNAAERTANIVAVKAFDQELSKREKHAAGEAVHYVFGATTGAIYGAASELMPEVSIGVGLPFGAAVWFIADEVVVPKLGLSKEARDYPLSIHLSAFASHCVYGVATDVFRRIANRAMGNHSNE